VKRFLLALALACATVTPASAQHVLNLRDADIRAFIQDAARVTGRTFIIDPAVQGRVSVVTDRPLSRSEYFELFLSTLRANGYVAVPASGGALRVQPIAGAAASAPVGGSRRGSPSGFITEILRVRNLDAAAAVETLRPLVSRDGTITAGRNSIVISDFADNVRRIRQVLASIDVDTGVTRVIGLDNAGAREIAEALAELAPDGVSVVPVDSSNAIALRGDGASVAQLIGIAQELDLRAASGSEIRVVFLEHADAEQLLPVLQQLLGQAVTPPTTRQRLRRSRRADAGTDSTADIAGEAPAPPPASAAPAAAPGATPLSARNAVVTRFEGANAIVISATPDIQRTLGEVIRQLDVRRQQVLVEAIIVEISDNAAQQLGVQLFLSGLQGSNIPFAVTNYSNIAPNANLIAGAIAARELGASEDLVDELTDGDRLDRQRNRWPRRRRLPRRQCDLRRHRQRGAQRQPVEHPLDAIDHDARQSGSAHPGRAGDSDHHRRGAVAQFRQRLPDRPAPECRHHARGQAADQCRRLDQARPQAGSELDRRAGIEQLPGPHPQQARARDHDHRRRRRDRRHRRAARRQ
jgi:general secretion pathway protein D